MGRPNVGGAAVKRTLSLHELGVIEKHAFEHGFEAGLKAAQRMTQLPVDDDPCPMCELKREHQKLRQALAVQQLPENRRRRPG